eukprot:m.309936 g.309936  ORF g.309936 m.309936 type:complete len:1642 (+) comp48637_c0_seq1:73-4998(+)
MAPRRTALNIVSGEISNVVAAMRRSSRYTRSQEEDQHPLLHSFNVLKETLSSASDLRQIDVNLFLAPFLDVIRSEDTTGPVTALALSAVNKFLSYGFVDVGREGAAAGIDNLADAVTHARFVGTDSSSDEVVLMKILQVLRTLLLTPVGRLMTNESVCESMQSCFRICFELRLSELLRKCAEHTLVDMVQLLFQRLKHFKEDTKVSVSVDTSMRKVLKTGMVSSVGQAIVSHEVAAEAEDQVDDVEKEEKDKEIAHTDGSNTEAETKEDNPETENDGEKEEEEEEVEPLASPKEPYINRRGIKFTQKRTGPLLPYGLPCIRELFRFLIALINPRERHKSDLLMIQMGLSLLTVALECGCHSIANLQSMLQYVQDDLCKNLFQLLKWESTQVFSLSIHILFLLFESLRDNLKFQLEMFVGVLMDLFGKSHSGNSKAVAVERKETALECVVKLCQIPYLVTELYLNFDADLYSSNVFEELTKLLSKNAYPSGALFPSHLLCLDALMAILGAIKNNCNGEHTQKLNPPTTSSEAAKLESPTQTDDKIHVHHAHLSPLRLETDEDISSQASPPAFTLPSPEHLIRIKQKKKLLIAGTEQFNGSPKKGILFLQEHKVLKSPIDNNELAVFLRENLQLGKKMIGDYLGDRRNEEVLKAFVKSFHVKGVKIHETIRVFLESFRLPGESPIISRILEHFSDHWLGVNKGSKLGESFANTDAVFILCYAIILLNVDQHNPQNKKPMTVEQFIRNQRGLNEKEDFDANMLKEIYAEIKENEIIMPEEHEGQHKYDYNWTMLLRRGSAPEGHYLHIRDSAFDQDLFLLAWGPTVAALSVVFDGALDDAVLQKAVNGFKSCASVSAHYGLSDVFDNLVISLCKFTNLASVSELGENVAVAFGGNAKAQLAATTLFTLAHQHGNILREGWKNLLDCLLQIFKAKLLPEELVKADDFLDPSGFVSIMPEEAPSQRSDGSLFSSLFSWTSEPSSSRNLTSEDRQAQLKAVECIRDCHPEALFAESKFLMKDSLVELVKALEFASRGPDAHQSLGTQFDEEAAVFNLELLLRVVLHNRDRIDLLWCGVKEHLTRILAQAEASSFLVQRATIGLLRIAVRLLWRDDMTQKILESLSVLLELNSDVMLSVSSHVVAGLSELLRSNASYIKSKEGWLILFTLIESCGTGAKSHVCQKSIESQSLTKKGEEDEPDGSAMELFLWRPEAMKFKGVTSLGKTCETLAFLVQEVKCLTAENLPACIHVVRTLAEASCHGSKHQSGGDGEPKGKGRKAHRNSGNREKRTNKGGGGRTSPLRDEVSVSYSFDTMTLQLLELMQLLHCKVRSIYSKDVGVVADEDQLGFLWSSCWGPLLQGMASFCCDPRRDVRQTAVTILQRSLLLQDIQILNAREWEACFSQVFFPMLRRLLVDINPDDPSGVEEIRIRVSALLAKVFLQHLTPLLSLSSFREIWMAVLDFMDHFMSSTQSELLAESIPESLKNMLLVMSTAGVFDAPVTSPSESPHSQLWTDTWERIHKFIPGLHDQLFAPAPTRRPSLPATQSKKLESADSGVSLSGSVVLQPPLPTFTFKSVLQPTSPSGTVVNSVETVPIILRPTPTVAPGIAKPASVSPQSSSRVSTPVPQTEEGGAVDGKGPDDDVIDI